MTVLRTGGLEVAQLHLRPLGESSDVKPGVTDLGKSAETADLRAECVAWSRHLMGVVPGESVIERYAAGVARLFPVEDDSRDVALLNFAQRHRWAVGCLDAAATASRPDNALRRRLILLTAILETTPEAAPRFLNNGTSRSHVACGLASIAVAYCIKRPVGELLLLVAGAR